MIPLSIPNISAVEQEAVAKTLAEGWVSTAGPAIAEFESKIADYTGSRFCVSTNSGTAALHLALLSAGIGPGQMVLVPNLTFVATVNPILYVGASPILVDCDAQTWQMDLSLLAGFLERETEVRDGKCMHKASGQWISCLLPTHVLGYPCAPDRLLEIAEAHALFLIEDASEAMGSRWRGRHLGSIGDIGCLSFNGNKTMSTGGGGALLTDDPETAAQARHLASQAKRHPDEYLHDELGYNYGLPSMGAALGTAQLGRMPEFLQRKTEIDQRYRAELQGLGDMRFVEIPEGAPNHWLFTVQSGSARVLEEVLFTKSIQTRKLWLPMNLLPMYQECIYVSEQDHSQSVYEDSLSLPCSTGLTEAEQEQVIAAIRDFFGE